MFKHKFVVTWDFREESNDKLTCTCIVRHLDGYEDTSSITSKLDTSEGLTDVQRIGSTRTYLMRYTFIAVLGLTTADEDNDGKTATLVQKASEITEPEEIKNPDEIKIDIDRKIMETFIEKKQ